MHIKKRKFIETLGLSIILISSTNVFAKSLDIENHWAKNSIIKLEEKNILKGYQDNTFKPNKSITREEVCSALNTYLGGQKGLKASFPDVKGRWSESAIANLASRNLISGYPDGTFKPKNNMTREEFASILFKYLSSKQDFSKIKEKTFSDIDESYAKVAITKLAGLGIINGYGDGIFGPKMEISRAEIAKILDSVIQTENKEKPDNTEDKNKFVKEQNNNTKPSETSSSNSNHFWSGHIKDNKEQTNKKDDSDKKENHNKKDVSDNKEKPVKELKSLDKQKQNRIVFKKTPQFNEAITDLEIDEKFTTAPIKISGKWSTEDKLFKANQIYTAILKLSPKEGYIIKELPEDFFSVGNAKSSVFNKNTSELTVTYDVNNTNIINGYNIEVGSDNKLTIKGYTQNSTKITIPKSINDMEVNSLGWGCFQDNTDIENVTFEDGIKLNAISDHCFANCKSLKGKIQIPNGVTEIGEKAFNSCTNLEEIVLPSSVNKLKWDVIRECKNLKKLIFEGETPPKSINPRAFSDMSAKTVIEIPENANIETYRKSLTKGGLPDVVEIINKGQKPKLGDIVYKDNDDGSLTLIAYKKDDVDVIVSATYENKKVTAIADNAFNNNENIKNLTVEEGITSIGTRAFLGCKNLSNVIIPSTIKEIKNFAFSNCGNIKSFEFSGSNIPKFENSSLKISSISKYKDVKVIIDDKADLCLWGAALQKAGIDNMIEIKKKSDSASDYRWAFKENSVAFYRPLNNDIESINIPDTYAGKPVTELYKSCFAMTRNLNKVTLPESIVKIGREAFESKKNLKEISIPVSVKEIGYKAFRNCSYYNAETDTGIKIIFNSLDKIDFVDKEMELGPDWTEVPEKANAFEGLNPKSQIILNCAATDEQIAAFKENLVKNGGLDKSIEVITSNNSKENENEQKEDKELIYTNNQDGSLTFSKSEKKEKNVIIKSNYMGKKVTAIADEAFDNNQNIETLIIEDGINKIGANAFSRCYKLKNIELPASIKEIDKNAFNSSANIEKIEFSGQIPPKFGENALKIIGIGKKVILSDDADLYAWGLALQEAGLGDTIEIRKKSDIPSTLRWIFKKDGILFRVCADDFATEINLPNEIGGKIVTELDESCFINQYNLSKVKLPDNLVKIGREAFYNKPFLKEISIPASVKQIGYQAFGSCSYYDSSTDTGIKIIFNSKEPIEFVDYKLDEYDYNGNGDVSEKEAPNAFEDINPKAQIILNCDATDDEVAAFKKNLVENGGLNPNITVKVEKIS